MTKREQLMSIVSRLDPEIKDNVPVFFDNSNMLTGYGRHLAVGQIPDLHTTSFEKPEDKQVWEIKEELDKHPGIEMFYIYLERSNKVVLGFWCTNIEDATTLQLFNNQEVITRYIKGENHA